MSLRGIIGAGLARVSDQRVASCVLGTLDEIELGRFGYLTVAGEPTLSSGNVSVDLSLQACGFYASADQRAYVDSIVSGLLTDPLLAVELDRAECIATDFVATVTPRALEGAGFGVSAFRGGDVSRLGLGEDLGSALVAAFENCGLPPADLIVELLATILPISADQAECILASLEPAVADAFVAAALAAGGPESALDGPTAREMLDILTACGLADGSTGSVPPGSVHHA